MKPTTILVLGLVTMWSYFNRAHAEPVPGPDELFNVECRMTALDEKPLAECFKRVHRLCQGDFEIDGPVNMSAPNANPVWVKFDAHCVKENSI